MGLFILRLFLFSLILAGGLVSVMLGGTKFGINIDISSWDKTPGFLNYSLIESYGFYSSLALFVIFLFLFTKSLQPRRSNEIEAISGKNNNADLIPDDSLDNLPDRFSDTYEASSVSELITEINPNAVLGTDGNIYDGSATFSGTETYSYIDTRSQSDTGDEAEDDNEDLVQTLVSTIDCPETGLSHLTDTELKSKTLDFADELRFFEVDYQKSRDQATTDLTDASSKESLQGALQDVNNTYEKKQGEFSSRFEREYKPQAVALRQEISKRLGISEPSDNFDPVLDSGLLLGTNPVKDTADLIEELMRKLA